MSEGVTVPLDKIKYMDPKEIKTHLTFVGLLLVAESLWMTSSGARAPTAFGRLTPSSWARGRGRKSPWSSTAILVFGLLLQSVSG